MSRTIALAAALAATAVSAHAQENPRHLASACAICHGTEGKAVTKDVIPLAGLPREHIATQMRAFRDGTRPATVMHQIAKGYTDAQIDAMAGWYAAQKK
jgi:cytochrome c553